jgi:tRNA G18 (ribose-2'-O)-methylase SpoU
MNHNLDTSMLDSLLKSTDDVETEEISLKQLVSVHNAIISIHLKMNHQVFRSGDGKDDDSLDKNALHNLTNTVDYVDIMEDQDSIISEVVKNVLDSFNTESDQDSIFSDKDKHHCIDILLRSENDQKVLLIVQLLLKVWSKCICHQMIALNDELQKSIYQTLQGIQYVTFPLLSCHHFQSRPLLRNAILDASLESLKDISSSNDYVLENTDVQDVFVLQALQSCLEYFINSNRKVLNTPLSSNSVSVSNIYTIVEVTSRIMTDLQSYMVKHQTRALWIDTVAISIQQLIMLILHSICYLDKQTQNSLLVNAKPHPFMGPITALLLPSILQNQTQPIEELSTIFLNELWSFLCSLLNNNESAQNKEQTKCRHLDRVTPSIVSAILCVLMSAQHVHSHSFQYDECGVEKQPKRMIYHPIFWSFIFQSLKSQNLQQQKSGGFNASKAAFVSTTNDGSFCDVDQMVRRRAIHILGLVISEQEAKHKNLVRQDESCQRNIHNDLHLERIFLWKKYVLVFEALEMESEVHLVNQVWDTVYELCNSCVTNFKPNDISAEDDGSILRPMTWEWLSSLFDRMLKSESHMVKKLGLYRLFAGKAGINAVHESKSDRSFTNENISLSKKSKATRKKMKLEPAPISIISPSFVLFNIMDSFDAIPSSSGTGVQFEVDGKICSDNLDTLLPLFVTEYTKALMEDHERLGLFIDILISSDFVLNTKATTMVVVYDAVVSAWSLFDSRVSITRECLENTVVALKQRCYNGSFVFSYRQSILRAFSLILSKSCLSEEGPVDPMIVLNILGLYPASDDMITPTKFNAETDGALYLWLQSFGKDWIGNTGAACASAFVSLDLMPYIQNDDIGLPVTSESTRRIGAAVAKLCALARFGSETSPSSLLWPAVHKGLSMSSIFGRKVVVSSTKSEQKVTRAILLLIYGCQERILSGIGHGDLIMSKSGDILPPSPNIEYMISAAVNFIFHQLQLVAVCNYIEGDTTESYAQKSLSSVDATENFAFLIQQLMILKKSYPSSNVLTSALGSLFNSSLERMFKIKDEIEANQTSNCELKFCIDLIKQMSIVFGVLSLSAELIQDNNDTDLFSICKDLIEFSFPSPQASLSTDENSGPDFNRLSMVLRAYKGHVTAMKSIFQQCKWGIAFHLVPFAYELTKGREELQYQLHQLIMNAACTTGQEAPGLALSALFDTAILSSKRSFEVMKSHKDYDTNMYSKNLSKIIESLFSILDGTDHSPTRNYMLSVVCSLIFRSDMMLEEYRHLKYLQNQNTLYDTNEEAPILSAFRRLIQEANTRKPHISKYALSYISVGWLSEDNNCGKAAIPYRDDILKLLIHKEAKIPQSNAHQEGLVKSHDDGESSNLPPNTPNSSISRGFLMLFLSKLPCVERLAPVVLQELCHFLIIRLLDDICLPNKGMFIYGGEDYSNKTRAWQALCILSRFVSTDIVELVLEKSFSCMSQILHGGIRYFVEAFTIQVSKGNIEVFIELFRKEILRCDLSQQHVSSLMIIGGNLLTGNYAHNFQRIISRNDGVVVRDLVAGVFPWLSSTQGFSRAIAQLLIHRLIPILKAAEKTSGSHLSEPDRFFLNNIWNFLEKNPEMKRLRAKQTSFFNSFQIDDACTLDGLFSYELDNGGEANPPHLMDVMKKCLIDIYNEAHDDQPEWKRTLEMMETLHVEQGPENDWDTENSLVNFQRKIVPMDSLQLALDEYKESSLLNAAGHKKQSLIICASLIDKATNLAGLTRTAEIFATEKIVVPDLKVKKMDNFKSICVGAEDWIDMEECKECDLMDWLRRHKEQGYMVIGIEQTSSSECLSTCQFEERSILLLGKEKEGIPIKYLSSGLVDKCVEIPQMGIIRSLNVHVSGAITIWEYSKQMLRKRP